MSLNDDPRFRIAVKQNAKNFWQIDATLEFKSDKIKRSTNLNDQGDEITESLGLRLLSLIKETEKEFRADGRQIIGDSE